jgi:molybdopterin-guanine dinucleotide biosynthesis protein A
VHDTSGIVIAGGKSRRMGRDKRFLEIGGKALLDRVLEIMEPLFAEIIVVLSDGTPVLGQSRWRTVTDLIPQCGSLGGLYTGLYSATHPRVFAVACDMPFLNSELVHYMATLNEGADVVMARLVTGLQPMHALYSKRCLGPLEAMARSGNLKVQNLVSVTDLNVRLVSEADLIRFDPQLLSFQNINTPADLEFARTIVAEQQIKRSPQE